MLRVGITGGLGSGKSTIARMFAERGAHVVSSDEVARKLMEPGQPVYAAIVEVFGKKALMPDGTLNRKWLAEAAFRDGRARELEAIVHPAVLAWQSEWADRLEVTDPKGVAMVESALIFESGYTGLHGDARERFDRIILVRASDEVKRKRFIQRAIEGGSTQPEELLEADAERRLALQIPDAEKASKCDIIIENNGKIDDLKPKINQIWHRLQTEAAATASN